MQFGCSPLNCWLHVPICRLLRRGSLRRRYFSLHVPGGQVSINSASINSEDSTVSFWMFCLIWIKIVSLLKRLLPSSSRLSPVVHVPYDVHWKLPFTLQGSAKSRRLFAMINFRKIRYFFLQLCCHNKNVRMWWQTEFLALCFARSPPFTKFRFSSGFEGPCENVILSSLLPQRYLDLLRENQRLF